VICDATATQTFVDFATRFQVRADANQLTSGRVIAPLADRCACPTVSALRARRPDSRLRRIILLHLDNRAFQREMPGQHRWRQHRDGAGEWDVEHPRDHDHA
jgi:hypothetical protein